MIDAVTSVTHMGQRLTQMEELKITNYDMRIQ